MLALRAESRVRLELEVRTVLLLTPLPLTLVPALSPAAGPVPVLPPLTPPGPSTNDPPTSPAAPPIAIASRRASIDSFKLNSSPCEILRCNKSIVRWRVRRYGSVEYWRVFQGCFAVAVVVVVALFAEMRGAAPLEARVDSRLRLRPRFDETVVGNESRSSASARISRSHCKWFCLFASTGFSFNTEFFSGSYGPIHF